MENGGNTEKVRIAAMSALWGDIADTAPVWLKEVKQAGYDGAACFTWDLEKNFLDRPADFKKLLDNEGLALASIANFGIDAGFNNYRRLCEFMCYIQCGNLALLGGNGKQTSDFKALGELLNHIGEIALGYGVKAVYHNHTGMSGETLGDMDALLAETDPRKVFAMVDTGHATLDFKDYPVVGERAVTFLKKHWDRVAFIELKDFNDETGLATPVGEGYCDHESVFGLLKEKNYAGWITVEQNGASLNRTPLECAKISREYIRKGLGV